MNARTLTHPAFPFVEEESVEATDAASQAPSVWDRIDAAAERHRQSALATGAGDTGTSSYDPSAWQAVGRRVHSEAGWLILTSAAGAVVEAVRRLVTGRSQ